MDRPILIKLGLIWVAVGAVLVISYHLLVRSTPVGRWLDGRGHPLRWPGRSV
jgi:glucans biosynthesis protein C